MSGPDPMMRALEKHGISNWMLARILKSGLKAKTTKTLKIKGLVRQEDLPKGFRVIATSGVAVPDADGNLTASTGETIVQWDEISHDERRQNRVDAQRLMGAYPAEKRELEHKGKGILIIERTRSAGDNDDSGESTP